mmetsp:Transcript_82919/g.130727  ORF Transcript_82919/g.130727 Transcript_82919/m.130727 type:complete len:213 (-) Transcript_82919:231-869(-)|eukprot:CAMPEP_0169109026 /NCGR_PEP_ID=MMETSP1015-20121227/25744_1 /TAXON_ID=342587 /ORGANISM="Karlodinium micrum, Strain CCMP2283" /LENGTH=212 /DNA_ID=CAMNT_0009170693 /DNA_START=49 /DNA_END=687 /DNA_ORIENTATION=+
MRIALAAVLFCSGSSTQFLAPDVDFEKLKGGVVSGESFQQRVSEICQETTEADCVQRTSDKLFCQLLFQKKRDLAVQHCELPEDEKFLLQKAKEAEVTKLPSGLMYKVMKKGNGTQHPSVNTPCLCNYRGALVNGKEFDSSYRRGRPSEFAPRQVIKAWREAMQLMVEGDEWELYVPAALGYGQQGTESIPGGATLVFDMQLVKIKDDDEDD